MTKTLYVCHLRTHFWGFAVFSNGKRVKLTTKVRKDTKNLQTDSGGGHPPSGSTARHIDRRYSPDAGLIFALFFILIAPCLPMVVLVPRRRSARAAAAGRVLLSR